MRILMISDHADPLASIGSKEAGGQNVYVLNLATFLASLGVEVDVFTRWDRASKKEVVQVADKFRVIRVKAGPKAYMVRDNFLNVVEEFTLNVQKRIASENIHYDVIFSNYWFSGTIGMKLARFLSIPQVHVYHSIGQIRFNVLQQYVPQKKDYIFYETRIAWEKRIAQKVTGVIATSPVEKNDICNFFEVNPDKVHCIPVGVDAALFKPTSQTKTRKQLHIATDKPVLLYVGRIEWRKGIETLLRAMTLLPERWQDSVLYVIGGGQSAQEKKLDATELGRLKQLTVELGLKKRVQFLGAKSQLQVIPFYSAADVCIVPSYYEPFGIVPLEAMASGTPVIASRTGGLQYSVVEGKTGMLATPKDAADFADKIDTILMRGKAAYSKAARERVTENFVWPKIARDTLTYLNSLVNTEVKK